MLPEHPEQADHSPYTRRNRAAAAHCVSLNQAPPDCPRSPEPARRPSSLCYLCRPAYSASLQGGTVQAIMSATVPPGLCESSHAHSGAFVFRIPGLPQFLYPYPSLQSARSAHSLMPGRAMPRRWVLRMRAGDCVSPAAPGESLLMMSRDQAGPERLRAQRSPLPYIIPEQGLPLLACHQALLKMPGTGLSRAQQRGLLLHTASFPQNNNPAAFEAAGLFMV